MVAEAPPAFRHAKCYVNPAQRAGHFLQDKEAARGQQRMHVRQRCPQVGRGMNHIGGDDAVESVWRKTLALRVALDIQRLITQDVVLAEALLGATQEERRNVGKTVVHRAPSQARQHGRRGSACAAANLEDAQGMRCVSGCDCSRDRLGHKTRVNARPR